jgi:hypothetical protein
MAFTIPVPLDAMELVKLEMALLPDALLVFVQPPLEAVPNSVLYIAGLAEIWEPISPVCALPPKVHAGPMLHGISPQEFALGRPLPCCTVCESIDIRLCKFQLVRRFEEVPSAMKKSVLKRTFRLYGPARVEETNSNELAIQPIFGFVSPPTPEVPRGHTFSGSVGDRRTVALYSSGLCGQC